jgi:hypothetical protein
MPDFTQVAADGASMRSDWGDDEYIQFFKDGDTTFRISPNSGTRLNGQQLSGPESWQFNLVHFKDGVGSWPCPKTTANPRAFCAGCLDDSVNKSKIPVNTPGQQWYFHAVDLDGFMHTYSCGWDVYQSFLNRFQRTGNISDRDYTVSKSSEMRGGKKKVLWDVNVAEIKGVDGQRPIPWDEYTPQNINIQLGSQWLRVAEFYGLDMNGDPLPTGGAADGAKWGSEPVGPGPEWSNPDPRTNSNGVNGSQGSSAAGETMEAHINLNQGVPELPNWDEELPDDATLDTYDAPMLRAFLTHEKREFGPRAGRALLLKQAKSYVEAPPY